jgi:hypothetical protein
MQTLPLLCAPVQFAAWQLQIKDKDYDPLVHVAGFLNLAEFLPSPHRCVAQNESQMWLPSMTFIVLTNKIKRDTCQVSSTVFTVHNTRANNVSKSML